MPFNATYTRCTCINRLAPKQRRWFVCFLLFVVSTFLVAIPQAEAQQRFRRLDRLQPPSPNRLLQKIASLQGVSLPQSRNQQLMELGQQILSDMPDEQKEQLRGFAEQILQNPDMEIPDEWSGLAEDLAQRFGEEDFQNTPGLQSEQLRQLMERFSDSGPGSSSTLPNFRFPEVDDPGASRTPSAPRNSGSRPSQNSIPRRPSALPGSGIPETPDRPSFDMPDLPGNQSGAPFEIDKQTIERIRDSISGIPEESLGGSGQFEPPQGLLDRPEFEDAISRLPNESVGNMFDRAIMRAVERQRSGSGESADRIGEAFNSAFGGLIERMQDRIGGDSNGREIGRRVQQRLSNSRSSRSSSGRSSWTGGGSSWGTGFGGGSGAGIGGLAGLWNVFWPLIIFLIIGGMVFWLIRNSSVHEAGQRSGLFGRRFRMPSIRTSEDLVLAMDRFLLNRFGKPSSWWHSRRAELALVSELPGKASAISELVDGYEYARYSEVGGSLSSQQIERCASILKELSETKSTLDRGIEVNDAKSHSLPTAKGTAS